MQTQTGQHPRAGATRPHGQGLLDPGEHFRQAMYDAGVGISDTIIPDGQLHRYRVDGDKPGTWNGWYILHIDHPPSGQFGSWRAGISKRWCALSRDRLTPAERETIKRRIDTNSHNRLEEIKRK